MPKPAQYWLVKTEPAAYSWEQFMADKRTAWTGVRNFQARISLRAMKVGDPVLFYHSVTGKEVVGLAKVATLAYPDPTATEPGWDCVDLVPLKALRRRVSLDQIKQNAALKEIALIRQSRLSVMPLREAEFRILLELAETKA